MSGLYTIWRKARCLALILPTVLITLAIAGCSGSGGYGSPWAYKSPPAPSSPAAPAAATTAQTTPLPTGMPQQNQTLAAQAQGYDTPALPVPAAAIPANLPPVKVAILLPLSGQHAALGQSMLNAAQMALFDVGYGNFQLVPHDTGAGMQGGAQAAQAAINDGASLILGPLFADSVRGAKSVAARSNVNIVAFSTDWTLADNRTFLMGFLPFGQVERVLGYAAAKGYNKVGVFAPQDAYGQVALQSYKNAASRNNIQTVAQKIFVPGSASLADEIKAFAQYDKRTTLNPGGTLQVQPPPFNAVFIPAGGETLRSVSSLMLQSGLPPDSVKRLGTGLWDDPALAASNDLNGAWFAAPSPNLRRDFEQRYRKLHGAEPPRLTTLAYDATALAAILAQSGLQLTGRPAFDVASITNPNGFAGIDGIFRFRQNGLVERGLAVLEFRNGQAVLIDEAPRTFEASPGF